MTSGEMEPGKAVNDAQNAFELWRLDDNANEFLVDTFVDRASAESKLRELAASGHRQTYWIKPAAPPK